MLRLILLFFYFVLHSTLLTQGQNREIKFKGITSNDGLSQNSVICIHQDNDGLIWVGTVYGLNMFDGKEFTRFEPKPGDSTSLQNGYIMNIYEDDDGVFWIGTIGGFYRFDKRTRYFKGYKITKSEDFRSFSNWIYHISKTKGGKILISSRGSGLSIFNPENEELKRIPIDSTEGNYDCTYAFEDLEGNIWMGTNDHNNGVTVLKPNNGKYEVVQPLDFHAKYVTKITQAKQDEVIIGFGSGLVKVNLTNNQYQRVLFDNYNNEVLDFDIDTDGYYWVGTSKGLFQYDNDQNKVIAYYEHDYANDHSIIGNAVKSVLTDREGNIWLGTTSGISLKRKSTKKFDILTKSESNTDRGIGLRNAEVRGIYKDSRETLWICTYGEGLSRIDKEDSLVKYYTQIKSRLKGELLTGLTLTVSEGPNGNIWIGTDGGWLSILDPNTDKFTHLNPSKSKSYKNLLSVTGITFTDDSNAWISTYSGGIFILDTKTYEIKGILNKENRKLPGNGIRFMYQAPDKTIWIAIQTRGVICLDSKGKIIKEYNEKNGLSSNYVRSINGDKDGNIWLGTNYGLNQISAEKIITKYIRNEGLISNIICGILIDDSGELWLSTPSGLSQFDPKSGFIKNHYKDHSLPSESFVFGSQFKDKEGKMYFGSSDGLVSFFPSDIRDNEYIAPIVMTDIKIFNRSIYEDQKNTPTKYQKHDDQPFKITYKESVITFEFASLSYANSQANQYAFKMEGFDEGWNYVGNKNSATYTNLDPGNYQFKVKASNNDGLWNNNELIFDLLITPPFWKTTWFKIVSVLTIILMIYGYVTMRTRKIANTKRILEKSVESRTRELNNTLERLKNMQDQLIQSEKMASIGKLASGVAHEVNNPLNFIAGGLRQVEKKVRSLNLEEEDRNKISENLNLIKIGLKRSTTIIKTLSEFAFQNNGYEKLRNTDIKAIMDQTLLLMRAGIPEEVIIKTFYDKENTWPVYPEKTHQIFQHLLSNAVDATTEFSGPGSKEIRVSTRKSTSQTNEFFISIFNTGYNIPKESEMKIFDPFFTTKDPGKGTGLGLWAVYKLVKDHEGSIEIVNHHNGVEFIIALPQKKT